MYVPSTTNPNYVHVLPKVQPLACLALKTRAGLYTITHTHTHTHTCTRTYICMYGGGTTPQEYS